MGDAHPVLPRWQVFRHWLAEPAAQALLAAILLAAIMLPYWYLATEWARDVIPDPAAHFTFVTTTFLLLLILADSTFLVRYYQIRRKHELFRTTEELKKSEEALRMANRKLNLLSGITRHDIKNQLMALKTYILLSNDSCHHTDDLAEYFSEAEVIADTIERQINFTKDYEDMGVNAPAWQDVGEIARHAAAELPMRAIRLSIRWTRLEVLADPLLSKVFYNLIDNALRYGGETMTEIRMEAHEKEGVLRITFTDDGCGVGPDMKGQLFIRGHGNHTGLGLFLTREILSITGISIDETGKPGEGACFEMVVPGGKYRFME
jgi:signal transduction histidine kinase